MTSYLPIDFLVNILFVAFMQHGIKMNKLKSLIVKKNRHDTFSCFFLICLSKFLYTFDRAMSVIRSSHRS